MAEQTEPFSAKPDTSHGDMVVAFSGATSAEVSAAAQRPAQLATAPQPQPIGVDNLASAPSSAIDPAQEPESLLDPAVRAGVLKRLDERRTAGITNVPPPVEVKPKWPVVPRSAGAVANKQPIS